MPYENIPPKPQELTTSSKKLLGATIVFVVLALVCIPVALGGKEKDDMFVPFFWGGIALICGVAFLYSRKSLVIYVQNDSGIALLKDTPSAIDVNRFINKLFMFRKDFLLKKYARFSELESLESKLARLNLLHGQAVLTDDELEFHRRNLANASPSSGPIGFGSR